VVSQSCRLGAPGERGEQVSDTRQIAAPLSGPLACGAPKSLLPDRVTGGAPPVTRSRKAIGIAAPAVRPV
jgi:hypothetical protein